MSKPWLSSWVALWVAACSASTGHGSQIGEKSTDPNFEQDYRVYGRTVSEAFPGAPEAALVAAACSGDATGVRRAVSTGANVNQRGANEETPLLWALHCDSLDGVNALLEAGADPNLPFDNCSAVCVAAGQSDPKMLAALLEHLGDPNAAYSNGAWTALRIAFSRGFEGGGWESYYTLLDAGADINLVHQGSTIGIWAASLGEYEKVEELLGRGYRISLDYVASLCEVISVVASPEKVRARDRVLNRLKELGVVLPVGMRAKPPSGDRSN